MKKLKLILLEDWQLKILSLMLSISLWFWINISGKIPLILSKEIQIVNESEHYDYKLSTKKVRIKLYIPQGTKINNIAEDVKAYVDVYDLKPGEYILPVKVETKFKFIIKVDELEPEYIKISIKEKPQQGR